MKAIPTPLPIRWLSAPGAAPVLGARLGDADVSHFSNAFTRKFGYRPGGVWRERGAVVG